MAGVSFDRATEYYDATRGLPPEVRDAVADVLAAELAGRGRCLEIGVGTGRIALPLCQRGVRLVGIDLSAPMLSRLAANAGGVAPLPVLVGDATALPLPADSMGALLASHVFHLVPDWPAAIDEARRVIRPGGVMLVDFGGSSPGPWNKATQAVLEQHGISHVRPGVSAPEPVERYLADGTSRRTLSPVTMTVTRSLAADLDEWEGQLHAWTWPYPPAQMAEACAAVRVMAANAGWSLDEEVALDRVIQWWAFDITAQT
jgi:ubiquinone/menaquinone biosynthesis C-methylase UbiE